MVFVLSLDSMQKKFIKLNPTWSSQSGQGIVEYILLLVVIIALASALLYQFVPVLKNVVDYNIGSYLQCLLDQGELPGLGGDNDVQDCDFVPINTAGTGNDSANGRSGSNSSNSSNSNSNSQDPNSKSESENGAPSSGNSNRSNYNQSASAGADSRIFDSNRQKTLALARGENGEVTQVEEDGSNSATGSSNLEVSNLSNLQRESIKRRKLRRLPRGMEIASTQKRNKEQTLPALEVKQALSEAGAEPRQKAFKFDPAKPLRTPAESTEESWSISSILKYILIIAGLIIIVWVIGSQIAQVARSQEK